MPDRAPTDDAAADAIATHAFRDALKSQYHAGLAMLRGAIVQCPDALWTDAAPTNAFWQVAYHTLFFTNYYLGPGEDTLDAWPGHRRDVQHPDGIAGRSDPDSPLPLLPEPYTREQALAYWRHVDRVVDGAVDALDLHAPDSGFSWYRMSKLEHQLVNLRHLQHHTAQLADRLRAALDVGVDWVDARRPTPGAGPEAP